MSNNTRALRRLIERIEEFLDEYKTELEADEAATIDDTISIIDRVKTAIESSEDNEDEDLD
jgi:hypothetical protein